jgi:SAM-dependent methyltransferase
MTLPKAQDWSRFWDLDRTEQFTKVGWAKRRIIGVVQPYIDKGKKALDAGCGSGFFSKYFCDQGMETVSLDYSEKALHIAQQMTEGRTKIAQKDLLSPHLSEELEGPFDLIFSDGLLEHFSKEDQDKILRNYKALLSHQGVVITFVPNRWSPWQLLRPLYMPGIEEIPFLLRELVDLNQRNGLHVIEQGGINTLPFAFSPDRYVGHLWGMLLFTIAKG